ncbi:hypothetical protein QQF64_030238 [Cirrhinus molitorella]|uniref:Uncharacterized protein n=1 Tax=Cirrhinus molitorella TaxID=172907 RepID=A0ABR3N2Z3_9TELE
MRRFRQQPQKQPAIRGIFISIHGVSVSACLKEREKGRGIIADGWGGGLVCLRKLKPPLKQHYTVTQKRVHFSLSSVIFLSDSRTTLSTKP